jgi:hypothetical protein
LRYLAAAGLAHCERTAAREILLQFASSNDPLVLAGVMRSLAQIGGEDALGPIRGVIQRTQGRARAAAEFARLVISHRLGVDAGEAPPPVATDKLLEMQPGCGWRVRIREARARPAELSLASLGERPWDIELAEHPMYEFECDRCGGMIMFNRQFTGRDALSALIKRPSLVGIGALRNDISGRYSTAALILTTPRSGGDTLSVSIHLTNGELVFSGKADVRGDAAHWSLQAVRRLGAFPIRAHGTFSNGTVRIESAESGTRVVEYARPTMLDSARPERKVKLRPPSQHS